MTDDSFSSTSWSTDTSGQLGYVTPPLAGAAVEDTGVGVVLFGSGKLVGTALDDFLSGMSGKDVLTGGGGNDVLDGGNGNDTISGGSGDDLIMGGKGNDRLSGGAGRDVFVFETSLNRTSNVDQITEFSVRDDTIRLENAVFKKVGGASAFLKSAAFWNGPQAHDASDRIIYDKLTGALYYDADGIGPTFQIKFAQLKAGLALTYKDFEIV